jgi:hypothetical protein
MLTWHRCSLRAFVGASGTYSLSGIVNHRSVMNQDRSAYCCCLTNIPNIPVQPKHTRVSVLRSLCRQIQRKLRPGNGWLCRMVHSAAISERLLPPAKNAMNDDDANASLFAIFDGHGQHGHDAAQLAAHQSAPALRSSMA